MLGAIRRHTFQFANEDELQQGLAAALTSEGLDVEREVRFDKHNRIDLLVDRIGIEVKVKGGTAEVHRQLCRYTPHVDQLVLVTIKAGHVQDLPSEIEGTPLSVVFIAGGALLGNDSSLEVEIEIVAQALAKGHLKAHPAEEGADTYTITAKGKKRLEKARAES
ncbi:MAG TPA: hypothetical protein VFK14_00280 [Solirubrobacterales bacterium]|nr:hypothetical protein [Solirubrobacterales bacterium]